MESEFTLAFFITANEVARKEKIEKSSQYILKNPLKLPKDQLTAVIQQHEFLERAHQKLGILAEKYPLVGPPGVSLEQASSFITANIKSDNNSTCPHTPHTHEFARHFVFPRVRHPPCVRRVGAARPCASQWPHRDRFG